MNNKKILSEFIRLIGKVGISENAFIVSEFKEFLEREFPPYWNNKKHLARKKVSNGVLTCCGIIVPNSDTEWEDPSLITCVNCQRSYAYQNILGHEYVRQTMNEIAVIENNRAEMTWEDFIDYE